MLENVTDNVTITESNVISKNYRYPGLQPYQQEQEHIFFGRNEDIENLYRRVSQNACTVVFGKSGIGKSSLINAGLLPKIKRQNNEQKDSIFYNVLYLRFGSFKINALTGDEKTDRLESMESKAQVQSAAKSTVSPGKKEHPELTTLASKLNAVELDIMKEDKPFLHLLPEDSRQTLWYKLKKAQFLLSGEKRQQTFLLFFDQAEEIFTYPGVQIREFLLNLSDILSQNPPDDVNELLDEQRQKNNRPSEEELKILYTPIPTKFLFAIRSDKLNLIARLNKAIPSVLQNLYELLPLSKGQAIAAIKSPANHPGHFDTPPFTFEEEAIKHIIEYLDQETNDPAITYDGRTIEPFNLQIICSHIEQKIVRSDEDKFITKDEIGSLSEIIKKYFADTMISLFPDEIERKQIIQILLTKFIDDKNKIRKMVYFTDLAENEKGIIRLYKIGIVKREERNPKEVYYELSHDRLISAIIDSQKETHKETEEEKPIDSDDPQEYQRLGDTFFSAKQYQKAVDAYTTAIAKAEERGIPFINLLLSRGDAYGFMQMFEESNADYKRVLLAEPDNLLANFYLGFNDYGTQNFEEAEKYFIKVLSLDENYIPAIYNIGLIKEQKKLEDEAIEEYKKVLQLDSKYSRALSRLGSIYFNRSDFTEAEKYFIEITKVEPQSVDAYFNLGLIYYSSNAEKAIDNFKQVLILNPKDSEACYYLGILYSNNKEHEKAVFYLSRCVELDPMYAEAWNELGVIYYEIFKDYEKARYYYENVLKVNPNFGKAYYNIALIEAVAEQTDKAVADFEKAIELNPELTSAYTELSKQYKKQKNFSKANDVLLKYISKFGEDAKVNNSIGVNYYSLADDKNAIIYYKKAIELEPNFSDAYFNLGLSSKMLSDWDESIKAFEKAVQLNAQDYEAYYYLGEVYENKGDIKKAKEYYEICLKINPQYTLANDKLKSHDEVQLLKK